MIFAIIIHSLPDPNRYFDTVGKEVTYPFGYGLSYTTFAVETKDIVADEKQVTVTAQAINTGKCAGKEVVQVYMQKPHLQFFPDTLQDYA